MNATPFDDGIADAEIKPRPRITSHAYAQTVETRSVVVHFGEIIDAGTDITLDDLRQAFASAAHLPGTSIATVRTDSHGRLERITIEHRTVVL